MRSALPLLALVLLVPLSVAAQVYSWKDANGRIHYSDQPPPDKVQPARTVATDPPPTSDTERAKQQNADKRLSAAEKAKADKEAAEKAEKQRADDERRASNCERARKALQGLESGQIRYRMNANGEREAIEDAARETELTNVRQAVDDHCSPRPATPATKK